MRLGGQDVPSRPQSACRLSRARNTRGPVLKRSLSVVLLITLASATAHAGLRSPQVPVSGTALSTFFAAQGQTININTQQLDLQVMTVPALTNFQVNVFGPGTTTTSLGAYNTVPASPALYLIQPASATPGWYELAAFKNTPTRLVVNQFDATNAFQSASSFLGADPTAFGFYEQITGGATYYSQDSRNPGAYAHVLAFNGTGTRVGWTWFACETGAGPGGDFADFIVLVNLAPSPVPVNQSTWGRLKALFR
jgi:hypothetical protein